MKKFGSYEVCAGGNTDEEMGEAGKTVGMRSVTMETTEPRAPASSSRSRSALGPPVAVGSTSPCSAGDSVQGPRAHDTEPGTQSSPHAIG